MHLVKFNSIVFGISVELVASVIELSGKYLLSIEWLGKGNAEN